MQKPERRRRPRALRKELRAPAGKPVPAKALAADTEATGELGEQVQIDILPSYYNDKCSSTSRIVGTRCTHDPPTLSQYRNFLLPSRFQ